MAKAEDSALTLRRCVPAAAILTVLCYLANALLGPLNQDEGWYLLAARHVMAGDLPHRDFFFTQGPVMPAVYALVGWLWSPFGVLGGRLLTALLGFAALLLSAGTAAKVLRREDERWTASLCLWCFLGLSLWFTYFTCIPKAYGLCAFGLALALRLLAWDAAAPARAVALRAAFAGVALALLAGTRLSMGVLLPVVGVWLVVRRARVGRRAWLWFGVGGLAGLAVVFGPWLALWPESFLAAQRFHAARASMGLLGVLGCLARTVRALPILTIAGALALWLRATNRPALRKPPQDMAHLPGLWLLCAGALAAVHLAAPVPYDDYLVPAMVPLAMAAAVGVALLPIESMRQALVKSLLPAAVAVGVAASPIAESWVSMGQDRFWVRVKEEPDLFRLWRAAEETRAAADRLGTRVLWTQDTYLAVEAGLDVPRGMEMGPFAPPRPLDASVTPLAAWSGYTYALAFPALTPAADREARLTELRAAYGRTLATFPDFGQQHTTLTLAERTAP